MADTPTNTIAAAKPGSGPLSGLYKTSAEIAQDAVSQLKQIQAANAAQNALEGYTKGLDGIYTPVADLAKSVGNKLMEMAGANPATAAAAEKVANILGITKDTPASFNPLFSGLTLKVEEYLQQQVAAGKLTATRADRIRRQLQLLEEELQERLQTSPQPAATTAPTP